MVPCECGRVKAMTAYFMLLGGCKHGRRFRDTMEDLSGSAAAGMNKP